MPDGEGRAAQMDFQDAAEQSDAAYIGGGFQNQHHRSFPTSNLAITADACFTNRSMSILLLNSIRLPERGKKVLSRNPPIKIIQAWKKHNPYRKLPASTSDGNISAGFARIRNTTDIADPGNLLLTPAQRSWGLHLHYFFFFPLSGKH